MTTVLILLSLTGQVGPKLASTEWIILAGPSGVHGIDTIIYICKVCNKVIVQTNALFMKDLSLFVGLIIMIYSCICMVLLRNGTIKSYIWYLNVGYYLT